MRKKAVMLGKRGYFTYDYGKRWLEIGLQQPRLVVKATPFSHETLLAFFRGESPNFSSIFKYIRITVYILNTYIFISWFWSSNITLLIYKMKNCSLKKCQKNREQNIKHSVGKISKIVSFSILNKLSIPANVHKRSSSMYTSTFRINGW